MKQYRLSTALFILLFTVAFNSSCQKKDPSVILISADSLEIVLNREQAILLDVRTPEEFAEGYIPGAINIDYENDGFSLALDTLDKSKSYVVYCRSGRRSAESATMMSEKGFNKIYHLEGGILVWQERKSKR